MEILYHYLWKTGVSGRKFTCSSGEPIEVISPGIHNKDSGPDFLNAKIRIGDTYWVGNVEIHVKASDWYRHGHHSDPAYDNIILHVVGESDIPILRKNGSVIPQIEIYLTPEYVNAINTFAKNINAIRCAPLFGRLSNLVITDWLETLSIERLISKAEKILDIHASVSRDWEQTCFILLARSLGFGLNGDPMEWVARSIPLKLLHHHSDDSFQIQALLFGQACMLDSTLFPDDSFYQRLCSEYYFLAKKYGLSPINKGLWKYSKTRPGNFPHRRLAWLASLCEGGFALFAKFLSLQKDIDSFRDLFKQQMTGYWADHISFGDEGRSGSVALSNNSIDSIIINAVIPLLYAYSHTIGDYEQAELIYNMQSELKPEENYIIREWKNIGLKPENASRSQALIQLKKNYCEVGKCIYCRFGISLLSKQFYNHATSTSS